MNKIELIKMNDKIKSIKIVNDNKDNKDNKDEINNKDEM